MDHAVSLVYNGIRTWKNDNGFYLSRKPAMNFTQYRQLQHSPVRVHRNNGRCVLHITPSHYYVNLKDAVLFGELIPARQSLLRRVSL